MILERSSIDVGDGWFTLLDCLLEQLQTRARSGLDPQPVAEQIKEKYGELRVYLKVYSDAQDQLIEFAATLSCRTCDVCGSPGELGVDRKRKIKHGKAAGGHAMLVFRDGVS